MIDLFSRRQLLVTAGALGLVGCAGTRRNSAFWSTVTNTRGSETAAETRAYADKLPYASMLFWFDGQARSLIVLGTVEPDNRLTWYTADKAAITTYGPFVVAARGTEIELRRTKLGGGWTTDPRALVGRTLERETVVADTVKAIATLRRIERPEATATLRSTFRGGGRDTVRILGRSLTLQRIDESVVADGRSRLLNSYWIDAAGACHKSRQQVLPTMPPLNIEMLKFPAASAA